MKDVYFKVLDDGFIALKDYMGTDLDIEQAARVSYGKGTRKTSDTRNLLRYLMRHRHTTPFEMCELKFHIRAPIYVFRQWHRHRTWSYNEYSGRYSEMIDSLEKTAPDKWRTQSADNKQGSGGYLPVKTTEQGDYNGDELSANESWFHNIATEIYKTRLRRGVAKEQARKDLPVSNYTEMYGKTDLKNLLHFMSLRSDGHAQLEIRQYADIISSMVKELFPITFEAWYDYVFAANNWTRLDQQLMQTVLNNAASLNDNDAMNKMAESIGMSKREISEFYEKLNNAKNKDFTLDYNNLYNTSI